MRSAIRCTTRFGRCRVPGLSSAARTARLRLRGSPEGLRYLCGSPEGLRYLRGSPEGLRYLRGSLEGLRYLRGSLERYATCVAALKGTLPARRSRRAALLPFCNARLGARRAHCLESPAGVLVPGKVGLGGSQDLEDGAAIGRRHARVADALVGRREDVNHPRVHQLLHRRRQAVERLG